MTRSPTPIYSSSLLCARRARQRKSALAPREKQREERGNPAGASFYRRARRAGKRRELTFICDISRVEASRSERRREAGSPFDLRAFVASSDYQAAGCLTSRREVGAEKEQTAIFRMRDSLSGPTCYVGYRLRARRDLSRNLRSRDFSLPRQKYLSAEREISRNCEELDWARLCSFGKFAPLHVASRRAPLLRIGG